MQAPVWGFVQPCILLLLHRGPQHGYALMDMLDARGFIEAGVDVGNLYRTLRRMEQAGWVRSEWSEEGPGPVKRIYRLTASGEGHLRQWAEGLRKRLARLERFLKEYEAAFPPGKSEGRSQQGESDPRRRGRE
jgi:PadR family transcriptional regulator PadR